MKIRKITHSEYENLSILYPTEMFAIHKADVTLIMEKMKEMPYQYVIIDSQTMRLDYFEGKLNNTDQLIIVTLPQKQRFRMLKKMFQNAEYSPKERKVDVIFNQLPNVEENYEYNYPEWEE
ncbi:MAG: hypothetical protein ACTSVO_11030 [Candidatus Heimdallarchaeaceae archaeon]